MTPTEGPEPWTELPAGIVLHGALSLAGRVRVVRRPDNLVETTLPPAEAERLARALTEAGYEVGLESRLHPRRDVARVTILRLVDRLGVPTDPARLTVEGSFEMGRDALLHADVACTSAALAEGSVLEGDLTAAEDADVGEGARVRGRVACQRTLRVAPRGRVERGVEARSLRLEPGALVQGNVRARASIATPAVAPSAGRAVILPDDAAFGGELRLHGPVVVRPSGHVPIRRAEGAAPLLRVVGDVRVEPGAKVAFAIEATGNIEVLPGAQLLEHASAARGLRVAPRSGGEPLGEARRSIALELERALDL
jgi:hypothetical protein